jgi:hypothetical protein
MKSAYELAMERLNKTAPVIRLSAAQKKRIAELESKYKARLAGRELALKDEISAAAAAGDFEKAGQLQEQLVHERKTLQAELEAKKEGIHSGGRQS